MGERPSPSPDERNVPATIVGRLNELRTRLRAREDKNEYRDNVPALQAEIARLEALL